MDDHYLLGLLVALGVTLAASVTDVRERRIPNVLVGAGLIASAPLAVVGGRWIDAVAGAGLGLALLALPRLIAHDAVGFGDIKLAGIVGLALGIVGVMMAVGLAVVAASIALLVHAGNRRETRGPRLPFAPCLAFGVAGYVAVTLHLGVG
ncbi:MAG: A24 family peptidase [Chloroflexi bacterium]|nr:A24 family peptidase [Chloroflexota bacterium]